MVVRSVLVGRGIIVVIDAAVVVFVAFAFAVVISFAFAASARGLSVGLGGGCECDCWDGFWWSWSRVDDNLKEKNNKTKRGCPALKG